MGWFPFSMNDRRRIPEISHLLFLLILAVAVFLRFYRISDIPFTQDEFSAIFRTDYASFGDLINYGVKPDGHPAGIQVLLFAIIRIFGVSRVLLKIPFLLFGLLSLFFAYRIARTWFNDTVALLTTSMLAVLQYMVYYSQIDRPYMSGMFFSLWMVWCWTQFILYPGKNDLKNFAGMVLAAICCAYNHYFSMLFTSIVWLTGLFLIEKKRLGYYLMGGLLILLAYLPHLPVLLHQMKMKGIEDWLAKPDIFFVTDYLAYVFHFSPLLMLVIGSIGLAGFFLRSKEISGKPPFRLIAVVWFFILLAAGFVYSLLVSAVLQYSVLIFAFPFLLIVLFSFYPEIRTSWRILPVSLILVTGTLTLFLNRNDYITVTLSLFLTDPGSNPILVGSVESGGDELIWRGNAARDFLHGSEQWGKAYLSIRLPGEILRQKNLVFKTYLWNRDRADYYIDDFEVTIHTGNQRLYGLFEKID